MLLSFKLGERLNERVKKNICVGQALNEAGFKYMLTYSSFTWAYIAYIVRNISYITTLLR